jgi:hypothetical protein
MLFFINKEFFIFVEKEKRFMVFKENLNRIEELNEQDDGTAVYGITHLSDLSGLFSFLSE